MRKSYILFFISLLIHSITIASVKLPAVFSDGMVLQQKEKVAFWGWAEPDEQITITPDWSRQPVSTITDKKGKWKLAIGTRGYWPQTGI